MTLPAGTRIAWVGQFESYERAKARLRIVLPLTLVVVILGGLGSLEGALLGSLFVGVVDSLGRALFPELSYFSLFAPMAIVLAVKPTGLLGRV